MDIAKAALDWTRAEMVSSAVFILFGLLFLLGSFGAWQIGKTEVAKAYAIPALIAGALLLIIGLGLFIKSYGRVSSFPAAIAEDPARFMASELERAERVLAQYQIAVFRVIPVIIALSALGVIFLSGAAGRASWVTIIAMMAVILVIDTNASARLDAYRATLMGAAGR